ncbi:MAG: YcxB family protein [Propionibacteriaceae bacterium]|nr:YcxB family protein [Propionibacteriaceae bacterium]
MLEYTLVPADLAAFAAWRSAEAGDADPRRRRMRVAGAWLAGSIAYVVVFAISALPLLVNLELLLAGLVEFVDVAVGLAVGWWEWRNGRMAAWLLRRGNLTRARVALEKSGTARRVWLDADGLNVAAGERTAQVGWTGITGVTETDAHVFVHTGAEAAHVIPRRAGSEVDILVAELRRHVS